MSATQALYLETMLVDKALGRKDLVLHNSGMFGHYRGLYDITIFRLESGTDNLLVPELSRDVFVVSVTITCDVLDVGMFMSEAVPFMSRHGIITVISFSQSPANVHVVSLFGCLAPCSTHSDLTLTGFCPMCNGYGFQISPVKLQEYNIYLVSAAALLFKRMGVRPKSCTIMSRW